MSLAQHVTQAEGFDCSRPFTNSQHPSNGDRETSSTNQHVGSTKPEWRGMNFAPAHSTYEAPHVAAYKVSVAKRSAQVATGVVACGLSAGIVFGFAALKPVLIAEGVYGDLCDPNDASRTYGSDINYKIPCDEQDLRLNLFFIVASVTANVSSLLAGSALDKYGRRSCWIVACASLMLGSLLMAASFAVPKLDGYLVANVLLSLGGTFIFVPSFQLANAFPKYSGTIVALVTGAFDASAAVFLLYRVVYEATGGRISIRKFFIGYAIVPAFIIIAELAYMPARSYHSISELEGKIDRAQDDSRDAHVSDRDIRDSGELIRIQSARAERRMAKLDQIEDLTGDAEHREERRRVTEQRQTASGVWGVMHGVPTRKQMLSPWFMLILLLTAIQMLRMNYFIATIRAQYRYMLGSEGLSTEINRFFDVALPVGGVVSTPFIGILLNNFSVSMIFGFLTVFVVIIAVLNCLPHLWAGYATVVAFVVFRPLYYSTISDYVTKVFGFSTFGRIYGTIVSVSGIINLAQSGLDAITHEALDGDPTPINIAFAGAGVSVGAVLTFFVTVKGRMFATRERATPHFGDEQGPLLSVRRDEYGTGG